MKIDPKLAVDALKAARVVVAGEEDSILNGYAIGGWTDKSKPPTLSIEGRYYYKPIKAALKKIDAALATAK